MTGVKRPKKQAVSLRGESAFGDNVSLFIIYAKPKLVPSGQSDRMGRAARGSRPKGNQFGCQPPIFLTRLAGLDRPGHVRDF
jgi:hypothetical protein